MVRRFLMVTLTVCGVLAVTIAARAQDGRWKLDSDGSCVFDATDSGPDQCSPTTGRWKVDGDGGCFFDATDSGPDQCSPGTTPETEAAADSEIASRETPVGAGRADRGSGGENRQVALERSLAGHY
ncbi:MAG TPA: hypothetical protein VEL79_06145 [Vicinamibacterales bacterium]|nr:hypothetical protein [Vicinamibacterales bacterium]